jgi:DNA repair protein RadC
LGIPLLDHLIVGNGDHLSLRQTTPLWKEFPQGD